MNKESINKAVFLDRDGVINYDSGYVSKREDFVFIEPIFDLTKFFFERSYLIIVITNQSGIGRGYYTEHDFLKLTEWMKSVFSKRGVRIHDVKFSPFHPKHGKGKYLKDSPCRKPNPGMINSSVIENNLNIEECVLIGDKVSDMVAGYRAGISKNFLFDPLNDNLEVLNETQYIRVSSLLDITRYF